MNRKMILAAIAALTLGFSGLRCEDQQQLIVKQFDESNMSILFFTLQNPVMFFGHKGQPWLKMFPNPNPGQKGNNSNLARGSWYPEGVRLESTVKPQLFRRKDGVWIITFDHE